MTTNSAGMETLQIAHEGLLFDIPVDPVSWIVAAGSVDVASGTGRNRPRRRRATS